MSKPALSLDEAQLRGLPAGEVNRVSRARPRGLTGGGKPKFPKDDLPPEALPVWKHIIKQLSRRRTLTPGDGPALTIYCRTFLHWKAAAHEVETNGVMVVETRQSKQGELYDIRVINPAVKVAADLAANLKDSLKEFGLTGISRDKVSEVKPRESKTPEPGTVDYFRKAAAKAEEFALTLNDVTETLLQTQEKEEGNGEPTATRS